MRDINEYMKQTQVERQVHLDLDEDCIYRGEPSTNRNSIILRGLVADYLDTTFPAGKKINVCHACHESTCCNPRHIYWGTSSENAIDRMANGDKTIWEKMIVKYGEEEARNMQRNNRSHAKAGRGNKGKPKSEAHKQAISEAIKRKYAENK